MPNLRPTQQARVARFSCGRSVDIHCHCLPALDDGPENREQSLALCRALVEDGITAAIATPHQLGPYQTDNPGPLICAGVADLNALLAREGVPLEVFPGADVRLDERLLDLLGQGHVMTLADMGRYLLLELPHDILIDPTPLLRALRSRGISGVISHPERHPAVIRRPEVVVAWLEAGAHLQITSGSLTGAFGESARRTAWQMMVAGFVSLVASDAHGVARPPMMTAAIEAIALKLGHGVTRRICIENPARALEGSPLVHARSNLRSTSRSISRSMVQGVVR